MLYVLFCRYVILILGIIKCRRNVNKWINCLIKATIFLLCFILYFRILLVKTTIVKIFKDIVDGSMNDTV